MEYSLIMYDSIVKPVLKYGIDLMKRSPQIRKLAKQAKSRIVQRIDYERSRQEVYNVSTFYPSIKEYAEQAKDQPTETDPLISILLPTYNTPEIYLRECIESILIQSYPKWELCIADDNSPDKNVVEIIREYMAKDERIKLVVRTENGMISESTNSALTIATGKYVGLMDHDDILWPNALHEVVKAIRNRPELDYIYTDEDKIDGTGKIHSYPFLKPDLSPEFLESCNYMTHFSCIRTALVHEIGGFRKQTDGAQDWDLFTRVIEKTKNVHHIPKILYSWRIHEASTASDTDAKPYVYEAQKILLNDHISRGKYSGTVSTGIIRQHRTIVYDVSPDTTVEVIINGAVATDIEALVKSMSEHPAGMDFEISYISHGKVDENFTNAMQKYLPAIKYRTVESVENPYSRVASSEKDIIIFVSGSLRFVSDEWAKLLAADAQRESIGAVGPLILGHDEHTVLSAGLGIGYGVNRTYLDMLHGVPLGDDHYTRGLYLKSRRNVSALSPMLFATKKSASTSLLDQHPIKWMIDLNISHRNVYTPYVMVASHGLADYGYTPNLSENYEDPMLNPAFRKDNPRMEVRL